MLTWIIENLATILICMALTAVVAVIIISLAGDKKKGKSSCGYNCTGCPMSGSCHHKK